MTYANLIRVGSGRRPAFEKQEERERNSNCEISKEIKTEILSN